jgi:uncharacterized Rmd1/YagE family protein
MQRQHLKAFKSYAHDWYDQNFHLGEDYSLIVRPTMLESEPMLLRPDQDTTWLRSLDANNVSVISSVLGLSVALDHYANEVDEMMDDFIRFNNMVRKDGKIPNSQRDEVFRLVARNSSVVTELVSKVRLFERSDTAWKHAEFSKVWEGLREEFEIEGRFTDLDRKIRHIGENSKFFLEAASSDRGLLLEGAIVFLFVCEIILGVCDLYNITPPGVVK